MAMRRVLFVVLAWLVAFASLPARAETPDAALAKLIDEAKAAAAVPGACAQPGLDRLVRIFCDGKFRIGVREYYPLFGTREGNVRSGYDVDVARGLARHLGVEPVFTRVNAASRIPLLADDKIDLTIATMGHNTQRDTQVRFIRPHYYQSETVVVGPKGLAIKDWPDVASRTICVTIGNGSNAQIVSHNARLMLFDEAGVLPDKLRDETCVLVAQDDSFFDFYFTEPAFAQNYDKKFGFAQLPWGMAVALSGSDRLARALDLTSQIFHRDGVFLDIGRQNRIGLGFLERQRAVWNRPDCNTDTGTTNPACVLPALRRGAGTDALCGSGDRLRGLAGEAYRHRRPIAYVQDHAGLAVVQGRHHQFAGPRGRRPRGDAAVRAGAGRAAELAIVPAALARPRFHHHPAILAGRVDARHLRRRGTGSLSLFVGGRDRCGHRGARVDERRQCRPGHCRGDAYAQDRTGRASGADRRVLRPRGQPLGDADRVLPRQCRQGVRRSRASSVHRSF